MASAGPTSLSESDEIARRSYRLALITTPGPT